MRRHAPAKKFIIKPVVSEMMGLSWFLIVVLLLLIYGRHITTIIYQMSLYFPRTLLRDEGRSPLALVRNFVEMILRTISS